MENDGEVIHAALFPVQPWLDVPDLGFAALVCADDDERATAAAETLAEMAWQRRADFFPDLTPLDEAIRIGLASDGMTVVSDAGDAPTGGSAADSAAVLKALLDAGADKAVAAVATSRSATRRRCRSRRRRARGRPSRSRSATPSRSTTASRWR